MAKKILVIGLGSTGFNVCEQMIERIIWEYGSLDKTPWIQFLGLETAPVDSTLTDLTSNALHLQIDDASMKLLQDDPVTYGSGIGLSEWMDTGILETKADITDGASQMRMLGRLAFLFGDNFTQIENQIEARYDTLTGLTPVAAQNARGKLPDGTNPAISLDTNITFYVVGTLCGGTCSGAFLDLGYYLQYRYPNAITTGIFTIPNGAHRDATQLANAYTALQELNYFSTPGSIYTAKFGADTHVRSRSLPYKGTYLIQTPGTSRNDYDQTIVTVSHYLRTQAFMEQAAGAVSQARAQMAALVAQPDRLGAPQNFLTFGISAMELPGYYIVKGCSYELSAAAVKRWAEDRSLNDGVKLNIRENELGISVALIANALLTCPNPTARERIATIIRRACNTYVRTEGLNKAQAQIENGFVVDGSIEPAPEIPPGFFVSLVQGNRKTVEAECKRRLNQYVLKVLGDVDQGPHHCFLVMEHLVGWLEERIRILSAPAPSTQTDENQIASAKGWLETCRNDFLLKLMGGSGVAKTRYLRQFSRSANKLYDMKLNALVFEQEKAIWLNLKNEVVLLRDRMDDAKPQSLPRYAKDIIRELDKQRTYIDETPPVLNGHAFYTPLETLKKFYNDLLDVNSSAQPGEYSAKEDKAHKDIIKRWELPGEEATKIARASIFEIRPDLKPEARNNEILRGINTLVPHGREPFETIFNEDVLDYVLGQDEAFLREHLAESEVLLKLAFLNEERYKEDKAKRLGFALFNGASTALQATGTPRQLFAQRIEKLRSGKFPWLLNRDLNERQSVVFVQERGAFSLPLIDGLMERGQRYHSSYENEKQQRPFHARLEFASLDPILMDNQGDANRKALILLGTMLKKSGESRAMIHRINDLAGNRTWVYQLNPRLPDNRNQKSFSYDLSLASRELRDDDEVRTRLMSDVAQIVNNATSASIVEEIFILSTNLSALKIVYSGGYLESEQLLDIMAEYFRSKVGIMDALRSKFPPNLILVDQLFREANDEGRVEGYYCSNCGSLLSDERDTVPFECPDCQMEIYKYRWWQLPAAA